MGYTHYWNSEPFTEDSWNELVDIVRPILAKHDDILDDVIVDNEMIRFDGQCETFVLRRRGSDYEFCKTRHREYDPVVVACIIVAANVANHHRLKFNWSTDGNWPEELQAGVDLAADAGINPVGPS